MPYPGADLVLLIADPGSPSTFVSVANLTNVQYERSNSDEDVSTKGDAGWQRLYSLGAQRSVKLSADFIAEDTAVFNALKAAANHVTNPSIVAHLDDGEDIYSATFHISSFSESGGSFGAVSGSISLSSSGTVSRSSS